MLQSHLNLVLVPLVEAACGLNCRFKHASVTARLKLHCYQSFTTLSSLKLARQTTKHWRVDVISISNLSRCVRAKFCGIYQERPSRQIKNVYAIFARYSDYSDPFAKSILGLSRVRHAVLFRCIRLYARLLHTPSPVAITTVSIHSSPPLVVNRLCRMSHQTVTYPLRECSSIYCSHVF